MTSRADVRDLTSLMNRLLAIALVIVTVLPILIFATDFTNSRMLRSARERVAQQERDGRRHESDDTRRERIRIRRANVHPTIARMVMSAAFQLVMLTVIAICGRRLFALRL